jgi:2-C-methyl-D-erythritol 4-phosphate cytidylyltransferase
MNALRQSDSDHLLVHREAARAWEAQLAIESVARHEDEDEYEACYRALEDWVSAWVKSGRAASRLLEADELRVVRRWLSQDSARGLAAREDLESLLSSSEAALAAHAAAAEEARRYRRMRQWVMVALVVMTAAAIAVSTLG